MDIGRRNLLRGMAGGLALQAFGCGSNKDAGAPDATGMLDAAAAPDATVSPDATVLPDAAVSPDAVTPPDTSPSAPWRNRGIVLTPADLSLPDWPERAKRAGLTTIALHTVAPSAIMVPFVTSNAGKTFLARCAALGLQIEYEMHAVSDLLPRSLFASKPELFRANAKCERVPDANLCVHNPDALAIAADNAVKLCKVLRSTTDRYFLWPDDDEGLWCQCACCQPLAPSDQALTLENHLLSALRAEFSQATIAHLAYTVTLDAPTLVKPSPGVFLEFCPFYRRYDMPFDTPSDPTQAVHLAALDANLAVFGKADAQALEFWMDASRISGWTKPAKQLTFDDARFLSDVATYHQRGVEHITSFGVFLDADYVKMYGDPPIDLYGAGLLI